MVIIRTIKDLKNKFTEIERDVQNNNHVVLTKNGHESMVILSIEEYSRLTNSLELALDEADKFAETNSKRLSNSDVFGSLKKQLKSR